MSKSDSGVTFDIDTPGDYRRHAGKPQAPKDEAPPCGAPRPDSRGAENELRRMRHTGHGSRPNSRR
jgi:hypothetical protein